MKFKMKSIRKKSIQFLKQASFPLAIIFIYLLFTFFQSLLSLPGQNQIIETLLDFIGDQGLLFIFIIALIEGGLILGQYVPGGTVIFLSIISAGNNLPWIILLVLTISIAFVIAYSLDYFIGYYGINTLARKFKLQKHIERYKKRLETNEFATIFFTYWETSISSVVAAAAGSLRVPFKKFFWYSLISILFWNIFWAIMLVLFGELVLEVFGYKYLLVLILIWIGVIFYKIFIKGEEPVIPEIENQT